MILIGSLIPVIHLIIHLPSFRYLLYRFALEQQARIPVGSYYIGYLISSLLYVLWMSYLLVMVFVTARSCRIITRGYERLSYAAIILSTSTLFFIFCLIEPVRIHMLCTGSIHALLDISLQYELPLFYITTLPWLVLLIMSINSFVLLKYSRVAFKEAIVIYFQERQLQRINQAVRFMLHSLKNDIFSLSLIANELRGSEGGLSHPLIEEHHQLSDHALKTIGSFLDQTRILQLHRELIDTGTLLHGIHEQMSILYPHVSITLDVSEDIQCLCDGELMAQAIRNCWMNACEASIVNKETSPSVRVSVIQEQGWLAIWIEDSGAGLSKKDVRGIFRPLKSGAVTMTKWGIGLNYSHRVFRAHRGFIQIDQHSKRGARLELAAPIIE